MSKFESLIDKDKYQVFVFCCPAYIPFDFFRHPWFVINKKGEISRYEIRDSLSKKNNSHLFINNQPPFEGITKTLFVDKKWDASLLGSVEGDLAQKMIISIEHTPQEYPYCNNYSGIGPNSNTYLKWILNKFPEFKLQLSWRFIGKDFHV